MKRITNESMFEIISYLKNEFKNQNEIFIEVLNPDVDIDNYAGEKLSCHQ